MAPASGRHGVIQQNAALAIQDRLGRQGPCRIVHQAGLLLTVQGDDRYYVPDLAVTCRDVDGTPYIEEPKLVVEIISPSTGRSDKAWKVPDFCSLPTVEEIWLIDSRRPLVLVWQKRSGQWIGSLPLQLGQRFSGELLGGEIAVDDLFLGTGLDTPDA